MRRETAGGRVASYSTKFLPSGKIVYRNQIDVPTPIVAVEDPVAATSTVTYPDGTSLLTAKAPAPRWGMSAPFEEVRVTTTPAGLQRHETASRTATPVAGGGVGMAQTAQWTAVDGATAQSRFTGATRVRESRSPAGRLITTTVDAQGRPTRIEGLGVAPVSFVRDARGRVVEVSQAGRSTATTFGQDGSVAAITDALGRTTTFEHDPVGRVTALRRADGEEVGLAYDPAGNVTGVTPPGRPTHQFEYDARGQLAAYVAPPATPGEAPAVTRYHRDVDGKVTSIERPDGSAVTLGYDAAGRLTDAALPTGTLTVDRDLVTGQLTTITGPYGVALGYTYDGSLLTTTTWSGPVPGSVDRMHDSSLRVATETVNGLAWTQATYGYDADGLVTSVATPAGALALTYDAHAPRVTTTTLGGVGDSRTYDSRGALLTYEVQHGGTALFAVQYTRDALGRIVAKDETVQGARQLTEYGYDPVGRLATVAEDGALVRAYTYDANGNRSLLEDVGRGATTSGTYDAQDRLLGYGTFEYTYTENGELRTKTDTATGAVTTYEYDALGSLIRVELPDGRAIDYVVDGVGRRVGKKVDGVLVRGWLYRDGLRPVAELDGTGAVASRFVYTTRPNVPEYVVTGGVTYRLVLDHLGSPRLVVNAATGAVVERIERDEYGNVITDTNPGAAGPFGFAGGIYDQDTGLVRFGARDYDPVAGRWTTRDPVIFGGGQTNMYEFVGGDPVSRSDPLGLRAWTADETWRLLLNYAAWLERSAVPLLVMLTQHTANPVDNGAYGDFDFWGRTLTTDDTFEVCGVGTLKSDGFGNFIAGFAAGVLDSPLAYWLVRTAGSFYGVQATWHVKGAQLGPLAYLGDSAESVFFIDIGVNYGMRLAGVY